MQGILNRLFIGTSGYNYKHWSNGVFYPSELPQNKWLEHYSKFFSTVELNVTFYRLPQEKVFNGWYTKTPKDFIFTLKGSRFITHVKKLNDCREALELFLLRSKNLREKLSLILWQLPPGMHLDEKKLEGFCKLLKEMKDLNFKSVFEFRHKSWFCEVVYQILKHYNFSICIAHSNRWPSIEKITADPVYLRFHGGTVLYGSNYSDEELKYWSNNIKCWLAEGRSVYAYFNNDAHGFAVQNALRLKELVEYSSI
jgi:uncharacterized protein YecE (DUF72 family)